MASYNNNAFGSGVSSLHNNVVGAVASGGILDTFLHRLHAGQDMKMRLALEQQRAWNQQTLQDRAHEQGKELLDIKHKQGLESDTKKHDLARETYADHGLVSPGFGEAKNSRSAKFYQGISSAAGQLGVDLEDPAMLPHLVKALAGFKSSTASAPSSTAAPAAPAPATSAPAASATTSAGGTSTPAGGATSGSGTASTTPARRRRNTASHGGGTSGGTSTSSPPPLPKTSSSSSSSKTSRPRRTGSSTTSPSASE